jgi:hypothetical protein
MSSVNVADFYEFWAIQRYHHVTVIAAPATCAALEARIGKSSSRHELRTSAYLPADRVVVIRTHELDQVRDGFTMHWDL